MQVNMGRGKFLKVAFPIWQMDASNPPSYS